MILHFRLPLPGQRCRPDEKGIETKHAFRHAGAAPGRNEHGLHRYTRCGFAQSTVSCSSKRASAWAGLEAWPHQA